MILSSFCCRNASFLSAGRRREYIKLSFRSASDQMAVRADLKPMIERNAARAKRAALLDGGGGGGGGSGGAGGGGGKGWSDPLSVLIDLREYDVPYTTRVSIDRDVRVGKWYRVAPLKAGGASSSVGAGASSSSASSAGPAVSGVDLVRIEPTPPDFVVGAEPRICAWDIETTKAPLKFPDSRVDQVYMISYMMDAQGYLLINREVVGGDVPDFEYTPLPEFKGPFIVHNLQNEEAVLRHFIQHCQAVKPQIYVTYNGDFFDWPFVDARCKTYGMDLRRLLGVGPVGDGAGGGNSDQAVEYRGRTSVHIDVSRRSFVS